MKLQLWHCPTCDIETKNWRVCQGCGGLAVYQNFELVPIRHDEPLLECYINKEKPKRKSAQAPESETK